MWYYRKINTVCPVADNCLVVNVYTEHYPKRAAKLRTHPVFTRTTPDFTFSPSIFIQPSAKVGTFSSSFGRFTPLEWCIQIANDRFFSFRLYRVIFYMHTLRKLLLSVSYECNGSQSELSLLSSLSIVLLLFRVVRCVCVLSALLRDVPRQMFRFSITCEK